MIKITSSIPIFEVSQLNHRYEMVVVSNWKSNRNVRGEVEIQLSKECVDSYTTDGVVSFFVKAKHLQIALDNALNA
jgi:hypothetical protein